MLIGIPIYSDDPVRHDYVVQAKGAFDETMQGILNLKSVQQKWRFASFFTNKR